MTTLSSSKLQCLPVLVTGTFDVCNTGNRGQFYFLFSHFSLATDCPSAKDTRSKTKLVLLAVTMMISKLEGTVVGVILYVCVSYICFGKIRTRLNMPAQDLVI
jgi:hypothetical protein